MTGSEMKAIREKLEWTQVRLAVELDMHAQSISRFERDEEKIPKYIELAVERLELREKGR